VTTGTELSSLLGPVRAGNAFEETVERLLTVIKLGVVAPGDRFPAERELASLLGVSRITRCARPSGRCSRRATSSRGAAGSAAPS
jgi:hypothetical protein